MSFDPLSIEALRKAANELNAKYAHGTKRWVFDSNNVGPFVRDTQTGKTYGFFMIPQLKADAARTPTIVKKGKPSANKGKREDLYKKSLKQDVFDEDVTAFLEHYGVLGMKWGVVRTPEQLGHKLNKLERKRKRAEKKYQKVEKTKGDQPYRKYIKKSYKAAKRLNKREERLMDFMKTNFELFGDSQSYLNGKQADVGRKWLDIASANPDERFWMIMGERMRQTR